MKRRMYTVVLGIVLLLFVLTGCGENTLQENSNSSVFKEKETFSTSKEDYLKDIESVMEMSAYLEYSGDNFDEIIKTVNSISTSTKEGKRIKNSVIEAMELSKEGLELTNRMTEDNLEETLEKVLNLKSELDELLEKATGEQIEDLLLAAKKAGVTATDLQEIGLQ